MGKHTQSFDICVVCALYEEAEAVLDEFSMRCGVSFTKAFSGMDRYAYQHTTIQNKQGEPLTVLVTWLSNSGPTQTGLDLKPFLHEFHPRFVAMTGICAGYREKVKLGDLVVAQYAYYYEEGKIIREPAGSSRHLPEMKTADPTSQVIQYARGFDGWKKPVREMKRHKLKLNPQLRATEEPSCVVAPMASGMAVRGDDPFPWLREKYNRNTVALDMEAATFYRALRDVPQIHALVVKGVCDYADMTKDDAYHDYAARVSAIYLLSFIQEYVTAQTMPRHDVPSIKPPRRISRRAVLIGGAAIGLGLAGGGVILFTNIRTPTPSIAVGTQLNFFETTGAIRALAWSRDGRFVAAANDDGTIPVWDVNANKLIHTCLGHTDHVEGISWSPDGKYMVSGSADGTARIWNVETWETRYVYTGHKEVDVGSHRPWVNRVQWSPDGTKIVSCDQTSSGNNTATVQVWDAKAGKTLVTYSEHRNGVYSVAWSPNNKFIASGGYDGILRIWEAASGKTLVAISGSFSRWLFGVAWSPDGKYVAFGGTDYTAWVTSLDGQQKAALYTLPGSGGWGIRDIAWSPKGKYIAASTYFQGVHIIQSDTGTLVYAKTDTLVGDISALGWSPTDARIASGNEFSKLNDIQVWQAPME